ncbi:hypothetical protein AHAS_Ahas07G0110700 [Arachis hypogaea]
MTSWNGARTPFYHAGWWVRSKSTRATSTSTHLCRFCRYRLYKFTNKIWKGLILPRIELFTWFVLVSRVNTKDRLSRLGIIERRDNVYVMCSKEIEFVQHLFVTCEYTWQVWCAWISHVGRVWSIPGSIKDVTPYHTESYA